MKFFTGILTALLLVSAVHAQESIGFRKPGTIQPLLDYRLPTWGYNDVTIAFSTNGNGWNTKDEYNSFSNTLEQTGSNYRFRLHPVSQIYRESEVYTLTYNVSLSTQANYSKQKTSNQSTRRNSTHSNSLSHDFSIDKYISKHVFFAVSNAFDIAYSADSRSSWKNEWTRRKYRNDFAIGFGVGRVRNVTPVINALRFRERLHALGTDIAVSDQDVLNTAALFTRRSGYIQTYDRSNKYFWQDFYNTLPQLEHQLDPFQHYFLTDLFLENNGSRYTGFSTRILVSLSNNFVKNRGWGNSPNFDDKFAHITLASDYYKNLGLDQMIELHGWVIYSSDISQKFAEEDSWEFNASAAHLYIIHDRLTFRNLLSFNKHSLDPSNSFQNYVFNYQPRLTYYVENNVSISASGQFLVRKTEDEPTDFERTERNWAVNIGFNYSFNTLF